jgi:hypothetical protein
MQPGALKTVRKRAGQVALALTWGLLSTGAPAHAVGGSGSPLSSDPPQNQVPAGNNDLRAWIVEAQIGELIQEVGVVLVPRTEDPTGQMAMGEEYWRFSLELMHELGSAEDLSFVVAADLSWDEEDQAEREAWATWTPDQGPVATWILQSEGTWRDARPPPSARTALFDTPVDRSSRAYVRITGGLFEAGRGHGMMTWWIPAQGGLNQPEEVGEGYFFQRLHDAPGHAKNQRFVTGTWRFSASIEE